MIVLAFDLESNQPSGKIIQIGAVVGNLETGEILEELNVYTRIDEPVTEYIYQLTGINDDLLAESGVSLLEGYSQLVKLHKKYKCFVNPITWGGSDCSDLQDQILKQNPEASWPFGRRWIDAKTVFISYKLAQGEQFKGGLAKSMTKIGLKFSGTKHTATDDAKNTFFVYRRLLELMKKTGNLE